MCYNVHIEIKPINRLDFVHGLEKQSVHFRETKGRDEHGGTGIKKIGDERTSKIHG